MDRSHLSVCVQKFPTDKAYFIAKELLTTERTYLKDLQVITEVRNHFCTSLESFLFDLRIKSQTSKMKQLLLFWYVLQNSLLLRGCGNPERTEPITTELGQADTGPMAAELLIMAWMNKFLLQNPLHCAAVRLHCFSCFSSMFMHCRFFFSIPT